MGGFKNPQSAIKAFWGTLNRKDGTVDLSSDVVLSAEATVTLAQLNAGYTIVQGITGAKLKPVGLFVSFNGTFTTSTDIRLSDTASSPVDILTIAIAQAGTGVKHTEADGTNTLGAGWLAELTIGQGIQLRQTGTAAAGGTDVAVRILYRISS